MWADDGMPPAAQTEQLSSGALEEGSMDLNMDPLCQVAPSSSDFTPNCTCQTWEFRQALIARQLLLMRRSERFLALPWQPALPVAVDGWVVI